MRRRIVAKRDQLARNDVRAEVGLREHDQPLQRDDRIALRTKIERDEVRLAVGQHRDGRGCVAEMPAIVDFGKRRLNGPVAAVDDQQLRPDAGDGAHRFADLLGALDLVMEDVRMVGAIVADARKLGDIPRRLRVGQQCDPGRRMSCHACNAADRSDADDFDMLFVFRPL